MFTNEKYISNKLNWKQISIDRVNNKKYEIENSSDWLLDYKGRFFNIKKMKGNLAHGRSEVGKWMRVCL